MKAHTLVLFSIVSVITTANAASLRNINLHGFGTGTVNADPMDLDFMGMPVTIGGKGQGDVKGAMAIEIPSSIGLEKYFGEHGYNGNTNAEHFYGQYPGWLKDHSRLTTGQSVFGIKPLKDLSVPSSTVYVTEPEDDDSSEEIEISHVPIHHIHQIHHKKVYY